MIQDIGGGRLHNDGSASHRQMIGFGTVRGVRHRADMEQTG